LEEGEVATFSHKLLRRTRIVRLQGRKIAPRLDLLDPSLDTFRALERTSSTLREREERVEEGEVGGGGFRTGAEPAGSGPKEFIIDLVWEAEARKEGRQTQRDRETGGRESGRGGCEAGCRWARGRLSVAKGWAPARERRRGNEP
jgi:hypothetical protein